MFRKNLLIIAVLVSGPAFAATDADSDGWDAPADCDDNDGAVNPGAVEVCNGVDDDCDSVIDPTRQVWYADRDNDGYGLNGDTRRLCPGATLPPINQGSWSLQGGDCFDTNSNMSPGLVEVCDGLDNDCDGDINEGIAARNWHPDLDGDGHGSDVEVETVTASCPPAMYVVSDDDCDDDAIGVFPGAQETCDAVDQDCDGVVDNGLPTQTWYPDADRDGFGDDDAAVDTCQRPPRAIAQGGDCDDSSDAVSPDDDETCNGVDDNCDGVTDEDDAIDAERFVADWDEDGFSNPQITRDACALPTEGGWLAEGAPVDCNDSNADYGADCTLPPAKAGCAIDGGLGSAWTVSAGLSALLLRRRRARPTR